MPQVIVECMSLVRLVQAENRHAECLCQSVPSSIVGHGILAFDKWTNGSGDDILPDVLLEKRNTYVVARDPPNG